MYARGEFLCKFLLALSLCLAASASATPAPTNQSIPWAQLGASATAQYSGDGLGVIATPRGAQLRCVLQKLEGEITAEGLSLSSTVPDARDQLQVTASRIGRDGGQNLLLDKQGTIQVVDAHARYVRPGLIEEYSVTADGIRQDFLVTQSPAGAGPLCLHLTLRGARAETTSDGARLIFETSGRELNYNRLRVTDATGRQLAAWMQVAAESHNSQNQRKSPTASPLPRAAETQSLGENDDPKLGQGEGQTSSPSAGSQFPQTLSILVEDSGALYPLRIDPTFSDANWTSMNPSIPGANRSVYATVVDGSGNLYIGGYFTIVGNLFATNVAKWDGSNWSALGSGLNGIVHALAVSGSDLYAGGYFTIGGGVATTNIAKWNGSSWSPLGSGVNSIVDALAVSGSDLYVGGHFTTAGGSSANYIAKWDGSSWSPLGLGMGRTDAQFPYVSALAVSGSDLYAGGFFMRAGGTTANNIAKWNGSSWSALGSGMNSNVLALAVLGADLYTGGSFTRAGTTAATNIAKWNGSSWSALGSGLSEVGSTISEVSALAVSGSDLYAGGFFTRAGGVAANYIAKWNGSSWSALGSGMNNEVRALAVSGIDLYAAGDFTMAGGTGVSRIAKWNGGSWSALGSGMNRIGDALAVSGSDLYAAGRFASHSAGPSQIVKWNGCSWSAVGSGISSMVAALAVSGSDLYAGGYFWMAGGIVANSIAKWNGSSWSALGSGMGRTDAHSPYVGALAVSGSDLYAGGSFTIAGGVAATNIARWNGSSWSALGLGMSHPVSALAVSGSNLYAGGDFARAGGITVNKIAKWNGSSWSALGSGINGRVGALAVSGSDLYAGGFFTIAGGLAATNIAKWNGSSWSALGSGMNSSVFALAVSGSDLYAGGGFNTAGGTAANYIAKWKGSSWSALGSGMNDWVHALAASSSNLYAGGSFTTAGDKVSGYVARARIGSTANSITTSASSATIQFSGVVGYDYHVQRTDNLTPPITWTTLTTTPLSPANDGSLTFTDTTAPPTTAYYRLVQN